jgi:hypothetical protein
LPGIAQAGEFMLSNLCKAIFLKPETSWPQEFKSRAFELVASALTVLSTAARNANLRRGMLPVSDRYEKIFVPDAATLQRLKRAACFTKTEISSLFQSVQLPATALDRLVSKAEPTILANYDVVNGPLLWRPFLDCGDRIVVMIPGMVVSSIRQELLVLALESKLQTEVAKAYTVAVWESVKRSLGFTRNTPFSHGTSKPLQIENAIDGFFSLDHDKVLYCLLVTDPLKRRFEKDPFGLWTDDALEKQINDRISEVEADVFAASPAPNDLFVVVAFQGLGGGATFGLAPTRCKCHSIALSAEALYTMSVLEGGDPLALFNFARAHQKARERVQIITTNVLDEFQLYRANDCSFYFSDQALPNFVVIPPGDSLSLQIEIASQRDFHCARIANGSVVEVTNLHGNANIPIYSPVKDLGGRVRLLVEGLPMPVWIVGPTEATGEDHKHYALVADAISFWIWQFTSFLTPNLSDLSSRYPIEIRLNLPPADAWQVQSEDRPNSVDAVVETKTDAADHLIEVTVKTGLIPLLQTADNVGERELMRSVLSAFSPFGKSQQRSLTPEAVAAAMERTMPVGLKKMLLLFEAGRTPEIDGRGLPDYRSVQKVWISEQLDRLGEYLTTEEALQVGRIEANARTSILNKVAGHCFSQLEKIVATLAGDGLLPFVLAHSESVHREQAMNRLTIPTRLECFHSIPTIVEQLGKRIPELAHAGLASRLLVEYVVAQPPSGLREISLDIYDELRAWAHHSVNYAMLSDALHFGIEDYSLSLLPSRRLGVDGSAWQSAMSGHMRAFALDQIEASREHFKKQWETITSTTGGERLRADLDSATTVEFGIPLSELLELMGVAISIAQENPPCIPTLPRATFIERAAQTMHRSEDRVQTALESLMLGPRSSFWTPPEGYVKQDLYPWRYNRPLSYMRRPFLSCTLEGADQITWGMRHMRAAQRFLVDQYTSGKLRAKTREMRSFMNRLRDEQGEEFNKKVTDFFRSLEGLSVESRVKKIGSLRDLQYHLGDVDVLVGDSRRRRILVVECKDLSAARTPYEMSHEINELFVGVEGKKSIVDKHQARTDWIKKNLNEVLRFLKLSSDGRWAVLPLIVVDQPLPGSYIRPSQITVLSLEEIRRFWPAIRRA